MAVDLNNESFFNLYHYDQLRSQGWEENVASRSDVAVASVRSFYTHFPVAVRLCFESWLLLEGFCKGNGSDRDETGREETRKYLSGFQDFLSVPVFLFDGHFL